MKRAFGLAALALVATLLLPVTASADSLDASSNGVLGDTVALNTLLVFFAAVLVLFMQAGFALLEIGFSRSKNAGTGVAKILTNLSIAAIAFYAVGFAFAFGNGSFMGTDGFLLQGFGDPQNAFGVMGLSDATIESKWLFQFAFCAVSLAIVWGTTLERIKFGAYVDLRGRVRRGHLPDRRPLGVRRRLAAERRVLPRRPRPDRHAGLRRLDGGPPDRRHRRACGPAAARPAQGQVRP